MCACVKRVWYVYVMCVVLCVMHGCVIHVLVCGTCVCMVCVWYMCVYIVYIVCVVHVCLYVCFVYVALHTLQRVQDEPLEFEKMLELLLSNLRPQELVR